MNKIMLFFAFCMLAVGNVQAQKPTTKNPGKIASEAAEFEKNGDFYRAGIYYESAFALDPKKLDYAYNAGRCYLEARDYSNAAKNLEKVRDQHKTYDGVGFKYAMSLKQTSQYKDAKGVLEGLLGGLPLTPQMKERVQVEIKGCDFAINAQSNTDASVFIEHLDANVINSEKTEFAPIPFAGDVLYFSSTAGGNSAIFRTQKTNGQWIPRQSPSLFAGKMEKPHFGNGSFTPNGKVFYFTQCDVVAGKTLCNIYLMTEEGGKWGNPVKLPDYINEANMNTTHPFVTIEGDEEILYFSSDRPGGKGGQDLWYCTRTANSSVLNFSLPKNLGMNINTSGDEITPYYNSSSQTLYFSSNGRLSAGGLDIFKSPGSKTKWEVAENLGFPLNSDGDDLYFILSEAQGGGYFVSNRRFDPNKTVTTNDDIFYFVGKQEAKKLLSGKVYAEEDGGKQPLADINIKIFEVVDGSEELVFEKNYAVGEYQYTLKPNKIYLVEAVKLNSEYAKASLEIDTHSEETNLVRDIALAIPAVVSRPLTTQEIMHKLVPTRHSDCDNAFTVPNEAPIDPETAMPYPKNSPEYGVWQQIVAVAKTSEGRKIHYNDEKDDFLACGEPIAVVDPQPDNRNNPKPNPTPNVAEEPGVTYKVQVAAVRYYKESRYKDILKIKGIQLEFEPIADGLTRVLIVPEDDKAGFKTKGDAIEMISNIRNNTEFKKAFGSRYEDDNRVGEGFSGWSEQEG